MRFTTLAIAGLSALALSTLLPEESNAQDAGTSMPISIGTRIGGYGFREPGEGKTDWEDCRMDGFGGFATLDLNRHVFAEVGTDFYQATGETVDSGMDRLTLHTQVAIGARAFPDWYLSPFVQIGGGVDWTRIKMLKSGAQGSEWTPSAFVGVGGEINIIPDIRAGAAIRMHAMAHPSHGSPEDSNPYAQAHSHGEDEEVSTELEAASQALFYLRVVL